jgi:hypothetical protein
VDEVKIHCKNIDAATAVRKLRTIHDDVQGKFHDQWDWMGADFCVEVLATLFTALEAQVAALTEQLRLLSQPVSDEEFKVHSYPLRGPVGIGYTGCFAFSRNDVDELVAARSAAPGKRGKMANVELITCDYEGCINPFSYRVNGFNLCAEHVFGSNVNRELTEATTRIAALEAQLKQAKDGWDSCIADLREAGRICKRPRID